MTEKRRYEVFSNGCAAMIVGATAWLVLGGCGSPGRTVPAPESEAPKADVSRTVAEKPVTIGAVTLSRQKVPDGGLLVIRMKSPVEPSVEFEGMAFPFYRAPDKGPDEWEALMAVPFDHKPQKATVKVSAAGTVTQVPFEIIDGGYPSEKLNVSPRHVNPKKKDLERINRERAEVGRIYAQISRERLWDKDFILPIPSVVTSRFGTKRVFNGQMQSFHQGIDLRAPIGTPIVAPAGGRVVLAKDLFFTGNTVLLDHGYGLVTLYAHMSKLEVKVGDRVQLGQRLGLSGMTGRASGPHLHWGIVINKLKVNPLDLIESYRSR